MRVSQNLFDYGEAGVVALSTSCSAYGPVPAAGFGQAVLWKPRASADLFDLCTRPVGLDAQKEAMTTLRGRLAGAVTSVRKQFDWAEARLTDSFREMPSHAKQLGGHLLLLGFVGAIKPRIWRLVDVVSRRVVWESDQDLAEVASRSATTKLEPVSFLADSQIPLASGADFVEIQLGMSRVIFVLDGNQLVPADWSLRQQNYADNTGMRSGILSQPDSDQNVYVLIDPRTGASLKSISSPTRSKGLSRPVTTPCSDRIAISHAGGTVDVVDGLGEAHFSIRPFPQVARTEQINVRLSHGANWLGADGWHLYRIVNLAKREVAELSVPEPNMTDNPERVLYDRSVLATDHGVALMDQSGLSVIPYSDLHWQPVLQPGRGASKKARSSQDKQFERWRKPALTLSPAKQGRSWLYGMPDLPASEVPEHEGQSMQLLARLDLDEVASVSPNGPWPKHGVLYFFTAVDAEGVPLQDEMFRLVATRVVHCSNSSAMGHDLPELAPRQPIELIPHHADLPDISAAIVKAAALGDVELEAYRAWLEQQDLADQPSGHRLGGYPTVLQHNDLEAQAAHVADRAHYPPRDLAETAAVSRWRLLLQLDSDDVCMWGTDSGMLYFLIDDDDLARRDFSRVVAVCEGH